MHGVRQRTVSQVPIQFVTNPGQLAELGWQRQSENTWCIAHSMLQPDRSPVVLIADVKKYTWPQTNTRYLKWTTLVARNTLTLRQASNKLLLIQNTDRLEHTTVRTGQKHHNVSVLNSTQIRLSICTLFLTSSVWPTWNGFGGTVGRSNEQIYRVLSNIKLPANDGKQRTQSTDSYSDGLGGRIRWLGGE